MKKILEVIIDDDGKMKFHSECPLGLTKQDLMLDPELKSKKNRAKFDNDVRMTIEGFVDCLLKDKNESIYPIVRMLSMAEMMSTAQPYSQVEDFWLEMMHSYIPHFENYAARLKAKYGYDSKDVTKPITWINPEFASALGLEVPANQFEALKSGGLFAAYKNQVKS